jgi:hypothetical protein
VTDPLADAVADGDAEVGEGAGVAGGDEGDEGDEGDGAGRRPGYHGGPGRMGPADRAIQLTWTICGAETGGSTEMIALPALAPRVTATVSVTLCPARSLPEYLLRLT